MASRYYTVFRERKVSGARRRPSPGIPGATAAPSGPVTETTAAWPDVTPHGPADLNRATKWPVVKTAAKKAGLC